MPATPVLWLMGPTSSGKTTLAEALADKLRSEGKPCLVYDGDEVRNFFGDNLGFRPEDRLRVVKTICHLAQKAAREGIHVVVSALTANPEARRLILERLDPLLVVWVRCDIEECARRDPKGLYRKAMAGEIDTLIGYNSPYLPPERYHLGMDTEGKEISACVEELSSLLRRHETADQDGEP